MMLQGIEYDGDAYDMYFIDAIGNSIRWERSLRLLDELKNIVIPAVTRNKNACSGSDGRVALEAEPAENTMRTNDKIKPLTYLTSG